MPRHAHRMPEAMLSDALAAAGPARLHLLLMESDDANVADSVNAALLAAGLARLAPPGGPQVCGRWSRTTGSAMYQHMVLLM